MTANRTTPNVSESETQALKDEIRILKDLNKQIEKDKTKLTKDNAKHVKTIDKAKILVDKLKKRNADLREKNAKKGESTPLELANEYTYTFLRNHGIFEKNIAKKMKQQPIRTLYTTNDKTPDSYKYKDGVWTKQAITFLDQQLGTIRGKIEGIPIPQKLVAYSVKEARIESRMMYKDIEQKKYDKRFLISNNTNTIDLSNDNAILDHSPEHFSHTKLNLDYDANATCPKFEKLVVEILGNRQSVIFYELLGYCLYRDMPIPIIVLLLGGGGNGKGTLLRIISDFIGQENISNIKYEELANPKDSKFRTYELKDKLANLAGDISSDPIKDTANIKSLTGGDHFTSDRKNKDSITFISYAVHFFGANKLPPMFDKSSGLIDRTLILSCHNRFRKTDGERSIKDILKDVKDERAGILNLVLKHLSNLLDRGHFQKGEDLALKFSMHPLDTYFETFNARIGGSNEPADMSEEIDVSGDEPIKKMVLRRGDILENYRRLLDIANLPNYRVPSSKYLGNKLKNKYGLEEARRFTPLGWDKGYYYEGIEVDKDKFEALLEALNYMDSPFMM